MYVHIEFLIEQGECRIATIYFAI